MLQVLVLVTVLVLCFMFHYTVDYYFGSENWRVA
jgi:hypothetical protein